MSADMKAATERAQQMVATPRMFKADNLNLAAAFLEAESELKQERKAREEAHKEAIRMHNKAAELVERAEAAEQRAADAALPGLELAARICESCALQIGEKYYPTMSKRCAEAIRAEIERRRA